MRLQRIHSGRALKTGSLLALGALIVAPLLVNTQTAQADPILDALAKAKGQERYSDRGDNRRDDNKRDDNRRGDGRRGDDNRRGDDRRDNDRDNNRGGWGNRKDNDRRDNDRGRWERERQERERRERLERERRERERRDRDRWNNNNNTRPGWGNNNNRPGGWGNNNNGNGNWNWGGNSNRDSYNITGTVEDSRNQQNTLWIRGDNGQTYSIRTYQADRYRIGDRVRVTGNRNSDNPQISRISGGYGGRR